MKTVLIRIVAITILLIATFFVSISCSTTKQTDQSSEKKKLAELRAKKIYKEQEIEIGDNYFSPKEVTIEPNTIVIFKNAGISIHDVLGADAKTKKILSSDDLSSKNIYVALFTDEGEYSYYCHYHGGPMRGQYGIITVKVKK